MGNNSKQNLEVGEEQNDKLIGAIRVAEFSAGPLPAPHILKQYDEIVPGAGERLIAMAEHQTQHRQQIEARVVRSRILNSRLGLIFGLIIGVASLTAATISAIVGSTTVGAIIGVSGLASLVGVFVYGSQQQRHERQERLTHFRQRQ